MQPPDLFNIADSIQGAARSALEVATDAAEKLPQTKCNRTSEPCGKQNIACKYYLVIETEPGEEYPIPYNLISRLQVHYFIDYDKTGDINNGPLTATGHFSYASAIKNNDEPVDLYEQQWDKAGKDEILELSEQKYEKLRSLGQVHFWIEPYGYGAIAGSGDEYYKGLCSVLGDEMSSISGYEIWSKEGVYQKILHCKIRVIQGVASYIAGEMNRNQDCKFTKDLRRLGDDYEDRRERFRRIVAIFHTDSDYIPYLLINSLTQIDPVWDYKVPVGRTWGHKNRLGNDPRYFFYDIWSNIHYGYIGNAANCDLLWLLGIANGAAKLEELDFAAEDSPEDKEATREGFDLYRKTPVTTDHILKIIEKHKNEWNKNEEWKKRQYIESMQFIG